MGWLLGVVGVVLAGVLVDVLLPAGQMSKYVKGIFAVLLLFIILSPVVALFRQKLSLSDLINFDAAGYETDSAYIDLIETEERMQALATIRERYAAVYDLQYRGEGEVKTVQVYVRGTAPEGLGEYVCIVVGCEPRRVIIYESG